MENSIFHSICSRFLIIIWKYVYLLRQMPSNVGSLLVEGYEYGTRIHEILISKPILLIIHVRAWQFCWFIGIRKLLSFGRKAVYCTVTLERILFCINSVPNILDNFINSPSNTLAQKLPSFFLFLCICQSSYKRMWK